MSQPHPHNQSAHPEHDGLDTRPTEATAAGRDDKGRFVKGNPGGPGNPFARQVAKLRAALVNCVTEEDMLHIAAELLVQAKMGDLAAIKLLFLYILGKPAPTVNPDTLDVEEWQQLIRPIPEIMKDLPNAMASLPVEAATHMVQILQTCIVQKFAAMLADGSQTAGAKETNKTTKDKKEQPESQTSDPPPVGQARPSTNGNGKHRKTAGPSPNGGSNGTQMVPSWLVAIASQARLAAGEPEQRRSRRS